MMRINCFEIRGVEMAIKAMRLPYKSGLVSDSYLSYIGPKDRELAMKLIKAGSDHRKFLRLINAWFEIDAPLYWWKQMDTYHAGVDKVSESTMHCLMKTPIAPGLFEGRLESYPKRDELTRELEGLRQAGDFETLNATLPQSFIQRRIVKCSYEALHAIYHARKNHKLKEWQFFCERLENLPYSYFITGEIELDEPKEKTTL